MNVDITEVLQQYVDLVHRSGNTAGMSTESGGLEDHQWCLNRVKEEAEDE